MYWANTDMDVAGHSVRAGITVAGHMTTQTAQPELLAGIGEFFQVKLQSGSVTVWLPTKQEEESPGEYAIAVGVVGSIKFKVGRLSLEFADPSLTMFSTGGLTLLMVFLGMLACV